MMRSLSVLAMLLALVGCGGGGGESSSSSDGGDYSSATAVAQAAGCDPYNKESEPMMIATESIDCTLGSDSVVINWFNNNDARDRYLEFGGGDMGVPYVVGDKWVIECTTNATRDALVKKTGGKAKDA